MRDDELISDLRASTQTLPRIDVSQDAVWSGIRRRRAARTVLGGVAAIGVAAAAGLIFAFTSANDRGSVPVVGATPEGPLATYPTDGSDLGDSALLTGILGLEGDCLYVTDVVGNRYILALPEGYATWDRAALLVEDGQVVAVGVNRPSEEERPPSRTGHRSASRLYGRRRASGEGDPSASTLSTTATRRVEIPRLGPRQAGWPTGRRHRQEPRAGVPARPRGRSRRRRCCCAPWQWQ